MDAKEWVCLLYMSFFSGLLAVKLTLQSYSKCYLIQTVSQVSQKYFVFIVLSGVVEFINEDLIFYIVGSDFPI